MKHLSALLLVAFPMCAGAQPAGGGRVSVQVVSLSITRPLPQEDREIAFAFNPGTEIGLIARLPGRRLLGLDSAATKLTRFTDDKQTDLNESEGFGPVTDLGMRASADGTRTGFRIRSTAVPAAGATRLHIRGAVGFKVGSREKTAEVKGLALKAGAGVRAGPFKIRRGKKDGLGEAAESMAVGFAKLFGGLLGADMPEPKKSKREWVEMVALVHDEPNIKAVEFLGKDGKAIPSEPYGTSWFAVNGAGTYTSNYRLKGPAEGATVRITYYSKVETVTVALDLTVTLGF